MTNLVEAQHVISSELIWQWLFRWWRAVAFSVALLAIIIIYLHTALVIIDVKITGAPQKATANLTQLNNNGVRSNVFHIGTLALIPRDTSRIEAAYNQWQTTGDITPIPLVGIKSLTLTVAPDKNAIKVSGASLGCVTYDKTSDTLASYSCGNPVGLSVYQTPSIDNTDWKNEAYLTFPQAFSIANYRNGLIGISNNASPQLFYADMPSKAVTLPQIPQSMSSKELGGVSVVTDQTGDTNHFLLVEAQNGTVYFATEQDGAITYRRFAAEKQWMTDASMQCTLLGTRASCYVGGSTAAPDSHEETAAHKERVDGRIVTIDFAGEKLEYQLSTVPKSEPIDRLYTDGSSQLYGLAGSILYSLDTSNSVTKRTITAPNAGDVSSGKTLYFITDNKVYEYDSKTKQTSLRFVSDHLRLSTLNQVDSKVFVNAYIQGSAKTTLHTYELTNEDNTTPGERLLDILPIVANPDQEAPITDMDFHGTTIHVVLPNYVMYSGDKIVPDDKSYATAKQEALGILAPNLPDINKYRIVYSRASNQ